MYLFGLIDGMASITNMSVNCIKSNLAVACGVAEGEVPEQGDVAVVLGRNGLLTVKLVFVQIF